MSRRAWIIFAAVLGLVVVAIAVALWLQGRQQEAVGAVAVAGAAGRVALAVAERQAAAARERAEVEEAGHQVAAEVHEARAVDLEEEAAAVEEATSGELADWIRNEWRPSR